MNKQQKKALVPKFRFPEFKNSGEWEEKKLGEVGDVKMCKRIFNEQTTPEGDIPFYKIGSFGKNADAYISKKLYQEYKSKFSFPKKGEVLISAAGTIGRTVVYNGEDAYYQDSNIVWIENDNLKVHNQFLRYIFQIVKYNTEGGTIQRLYNNILKTTKFNTPSLSEQQKIADCLSSLDELIEAHNQKLGALQGHKKGLMQNLFPQEGESTPKYRFAEFKNSGEWEEKKLGEVAEILKGKSISKADICKNGKTPCIRYGELYTIYGEIINEIKSFTNLPQRALTLSKANDIIIPSSGETHMDIAKASCVCQNDIALGGDLNIIRSSINGMFLSYYFNHVKKHDIAKIAQGNTVVHLYGQQLKSLFVVIPKNNQEQQKIADCLFSLDELIAAEKAYIEGLKLHKKGLMQGLFPQIEQ